MNHSDDLASVLESESSTLVPSRSSSPVNSEGTAIARPSPHERFRSSLGQARSRLEERFSSLLSPLQRRTSSSQQTPRQIARSIRKLRRHDETTIFQRHGFSAPGLSSTEYETLKELCGVLSEFLLRAFKFDSSTREAAERELRALTVSDPLVRNAVQESLPKISTLPDELLSKFSDPYFSRCQDLWSDFLGNRLFGGRSEDDIRCCIDELKASFRMWFTFAPDYLSHAFAFLANDREYEVLLEVGRHYFQNCVEYESASEQRALATMFKNISSTGKSPSDFISASALSERASQLIRRSKEVPFIFTTFFARPTLQFHRLGNRITGVEYIYPALKEWNIMDAAPYAIPFAHSVDQRQDFPVDQFKNHVLRETVFVDEAWMAFYRITFFARSTYLLGHGFDGRFPSSILEDVSLVSRIALRLLKKDVKNPPSSDKEARACFCMAHSLDIDRYFKKAVYDDFSNDTASMELLDAHSRLSNRIEVINGLCDLVYRPQFENVPYLRRFKINDEIFIASDNIPFPPSIGDTFGVNVKDVSVDTMLLDGHTLILLRKKPKQVHFHATGHYPIHAGYNASASHLYIAAVRSSSDIWYFTTVEDGASSVTHLDESGESQTTSTFFILALRHDPSDVRPPYPRVREGAMDPTGPVIWMKFWPKKDGDYFDDVRLTVDDRILESFMNGLRDRKESEQSILSGF